MTIVGLCEGGGTDTDRRSVRLLREELQLLHEPGSYVGEVVKVMGKNKVLVKVQPEGKYSALWPSINVRLVC